MPLSTFPELLQDQVRRSGSRPLITFYDDATGERVELSAVTYANWVAKTASLLQDELGLERGDTVLVDLPTHWLGPVWLGACWSAGLTVVPAAVPDGDAEQQTTDLVVCGPDGLDRHAASGLQVVAASLLPMGARFATPLPEGVVDFGVVVWGQPDSFASYDPPQPGDEAWRSARSRTQSELVALAAGDVAAPGTRLLTDLDPCSDDGLRTFLGPLAAGGGTIWVANPDPAGWEHRTGSEQATLVLRQPVRS